MTVKIPKMFDFHLIDNIIISDYYELSPSSPVTLTITLKITLTIIIAHHSITPLITCARMFVGILSLSITLLYYYYYYIQIFFFIWNFFFYVWTWMKSWIWICILISWLSVGILILPISSENINHLVDWTSFDPQVDIALQTVSLSLWVCRYLFQVPLGNTYVNSYK